MRLTEWERDRLLIFTAAQLASQHRAAGLRLNAPEAIALICEAMFEAARAGATYEETEVAGRSALAADDVDEGVSALVDEIRLEVMLGDGTRLIVLNNPLAAAVPAHEPTHDVADAPLSRGAARETRTLRVTNTGGRIIRVSSHYPFEQVNWRLEFDRDTARGFHLDLPAGATFRWAPGESHEVTLVRYGGSG
ncbi:MAG: urease subunit gamma [Candidatus Limnocylindrales bacterium]